MTNEHEANQLGTWVFGPGEFFAGSLADSAIFIVMIHNRKLISRRFFAVLTTIIRQEIKNYVD